MSVVVFPHPKVSIFYNQWVAEGDKEFIMNSILCNYEKGKDPSIRMSAR